MAKLAQTRHFPSAAKNLLAAGPLAAIGVQWPKSVRTRAEMSETAPCEVCGKATVTADPQKVFRCVRHDGRGRWAVVTCPGCVVFSSKTREDTLVHWVCS